MSYSQISHYDAVNGMAGSCHGLHADTAHSYLIDCGLFLDADASNDGKAGPGGHQIEFPLDGIRALIAMHVHIDHVGRTPNLFAAGFQGPILCSEPSAKLLPIALEDVFKHRVSRDQKQVERYLALVDSPLASRFTAAYRELHPFWNQEALKRVKFGRRPLGFEQLITVDGHGDHMRERYRKTS
jgi:metallo-beta-lactamase family protein